MPTIKVQVAGKAAKNLTPEEKIVCRNSDYKVEFEFDEPWEEHELKTALFVYNGASVPVPFSGNICEVPVLYNTTLCAIGVFAGDLITTTPAYADCEKSIGDLGGEIPPPTEDVYNKLVQMIESGMLKGEQGEKGDKGDKGDAGAIKFIPVASLPTENIDGSAIYLLPNEGSEEENRYSEYVYIDGKWEKLGEIKVQFEPTEFVKFTDWASDNVTGVARWVSGLGLKVDQYGRGQLVRAGEGDISAKTQEYKPIVPKTLDYAVKVGVTTNSETLTDEEKASACEWLGAVKKDTKSSNGVYGKSAGNEILYSVSQWGAGGGEDAIARRTAKGGLRVALDETSDKPEEMATPRWYVDENKGTKLYLHTISFVEPIEVSSYVSITAVAVVTNSAEKITTTAVLINGIEMFWGNLVNDPASACDKFKVIYTDILNKLVGFIDFNNDTMFCMALPESGFDDTVTEL